MNKQKKTTSIISTHVLLIVGLLASSSLHAALFLVTSPLDSGPNTLRAAITASNLTPGLNTINFTFLGAPIVLLSDLPTITNPVIIDGYAGMPGGAMPNTNPINAPNNAIITIELKGPGAGYQILGNTTINGLVLDTGSDGSTIQGLAIDNFAQVTVPVPNIVVGGAGILVKSSNNTISGNFIGTDTTGNNSFPNFTAIQVASTATNTLIGGLPLANRNLIGGNYGDNGVVFVQGTTTTIQGNTIGLNRAGSSFLMPDATIGVGTNGDTGTTINGNVISGQRFANISLQQANTDSIVNNIVGADITGTTAISNNGMGIYVYNSPFNGPVNIIIGYNLVSGNTYGIRIGENGHSLLPIIGAQIINNKIGTNTAGTLAISNTLDGIWLKFAQNTYIAGNTISGNSNNGITVGKAKASNIKNNLIGFGSDGTTTLPNGNDGIQLGVLVGVGVPAFDDVIGGAKPREGNTISNNGGNGISLVSYTQQETIIGNTIRNNTLNGILINPLGGTNWIGGFRTAGNELIIGDVADQLNSNLGPLGTSNIISANDLDGIQVADSNSNTLQANIITSNLANGIELIDSSDTLVGAKFGGSTVTDPTFLPIPVPLGNVINSNGGFGVAVVQTTGTATDNSILSNGIVNNAGRGIALISQLAPL